MNRKGMSLFLPSRVNNLEEYEKFKNTKTYLKQKSGSLTFFKNQKDEIRELAETSGYKDFNKFVEHRKEWHRMRRKIPLDYLTAIGVEMNVLKFVLEVDFEKFENAKGIPLSPEHVKGRLMPGIYKKLSLTERN